MYIVEDNYLNYWFALVYVVLVCVHLVYIILFIWHFVLHCAKINTLIPTDNFHLLSEFDESNIF